MVIKGEKLTAISEEGGECTLTVTRVKGRRAVVSTKDCEFEEELRKGQKLRVADDDGTDDDESEIVVGEEPEEEEEEEEEPSRSHRRKKRKQIRYAVYGFYNMASTIEIEGTFDSSVTSESAFTGSEEVGAALGLGGEVIYSPMDFLGISAGLNYEMGRSISGGEVSFAGGQFHAVHLY